MTDFSSTGKSDDVVMGADGGCKQMLSTHERNGSTLSSPTSVSAPVLEKTMEALSLVGVRSLLSLVLWYIFSFGAIFLNKYVVDMLDAEIIIFCKYLHYCFLPLPILSLCRNWKFVFG